ncbi:hypothetical protein BS78_K249300 [Paspalum vaginatum]|uniref:Uncharacterized protein n=1 Tax=Paspalum vaginatum TaxID=158149 RepID=A0A9W8CGQ0_9POAL|nr:hypothetical protein BS78_K249300 [Paspalum vaginatum]
MARTRLTARKQTGAPPQGYHVPLAPRNPEPEDLVPPPPLQEPIIVGDDSEDPSEASSFTENTEEDPEENPAPEPEVEAPEWSHHIAVQIDDNQGPAVKRERVIATWVNIDHTHPGNGLNFPGLLRECLQEIGLNNFTTSYFATQSTHPILPDRWVANALIERYNLIHGGKTIVGDYCSVTIHETMEAAIEDAARQALGAICYDHRTSLSQTSFRYFPRRIEGQAGHEIASMVLEDDQRVRKMARYIAALNSAHDIVLDELHRKTKRVAELEATLAGLQGPKPRVPDVTPSQCKSRKRTRKGELNGATRILFHED